MDLHIKSGAAYKAFNSVSVPRVRPSKHNVIVSVLAVAIFTPGQKPYPHLYPTPCTHLVIAEFPECSCHFLPCLALAFLVPSL